MQKRLAARLEDGGYGRLIGREPNLTTEAAEKLYPNLKPKVRDAMIKAHNDVWEFGMKTGREKGSVVGKLSGKVLQTSEGSQNNVELDILKYKVGTVNVVHNHPTGNSFSVGDMVQLNRLPAIDTLAVQTHTGAAYTMRIGKGTRIMMRTKQMNEKLRSLQKELIAEIYEQGMSRNELSHKVVKEIADYYGWTYKRYAP
ncbi:MAG: hypothetical protein RR716_05325 [Christensenellaceae bacterium]